MLHTSVLLGFGTKRYQKWLCRAVQKKKKVFYTALYHTMTDPRIYEDVDGRYPGGDNNAHQSCRL
jgi:putative alpha-1,2-mannosidase